MPAVLRPGGWTMRYALLCVVAAAWGCGETAVSETPANNDSTAEDRDCRCAAAPEPVCGADGFTYRNACVAACAGTTVAASGACPSSPDPSDPPTDPSDPPTDPSDPPTDPSDPPTDPSDPAVGGVCRAGCAS